ncbi:hypothetical protein AB833_05815 [Chromatiales bacterium (ex Bugula neritina AB1)]|nr:hypothetical protein AB833_05815 [Chromatiales bacterium (ex Bugula neritina AB1)]
MVTGGGSFCAACTGLARVDSFCVDVLFRKANINMLPDYTRIILEEANEYAQSGDDQSAFKVLRRLSLADFCELNLYRPNNYTGLCRLLPTMPSDEVQKKWVGDFGRGLMIRSCNLARLFEVISLKLTGEGLESKTILDYGCGWGRLLRIMNYYAPVENVIGIDAMQTSLDHCREAGIQNQLEIVSARPNTLPLGGREIDFSFAFSVFSHTPEDVTGLMLSSLRKSISGNGIFVATIRSVEWVRVRDGVWPEKWTEEMRSDFHSTGYAFQPINSGEDSLATSDYGDTIMTPQYFGHIAEKNGWRVALVDRDLTEPFQIAVALTPL